MSHFWRSELHWQLIVDRVRSIDSATLDTDASAHLHSLLSVIHSVLCPTKITLLLPIGLGHVSRRHHLRDRGHSVRLVPT